MRAYLDERLWQMSAYLAQALVNVLLARMQGLDERNEEYLRGKLHIYV